MIILAILQVLEQKRLPATISPSSFIAIHSSDQTYFKQKQFPETISSLFILDSPNHFELCEILKNENVHIAVIDYTSTDVLKAIGPDSPRSVTVIDISPLTPIHATQRLVHSVLKESDLTPSAEVQTAFEKIASFASGSPAIIDVIASLLDSYLEQAKCSIEQALQDFATLLTTEKVLKSPPELNDLLNELTCIAEKWKFIAIHMHLSDNIGRIKADCGTVKDCLLETLRAWDKTRYEPFTWDSIIACLRSKALNEQYLANKIESSRHVNENKDFVAVLMACCSSSNELELLDCLSGFNGCPIPVIFTKEIATVIAKDSELASNICSTLRSMKLLKPYPKQFIYYPNSLLPVQNVTLKETDFEYVPKHIAELAWNKIVRDGEKAKTIRGNVFDALKSKSVSSLPTEIRSYMDTLYKRML